VLTIAVVGLSGDADLVAAVRAGAPGAFAELYGRHAKAVRHVALELAWTSELADDIVQDTFTRALEHLDALRQPDHFRPWLLSIARHVAIDHSKADRRELNLDDRTADALAADDLGPDELAELTELARRVRSCVAGLSHRDATAVALVTYVGLGPADVAEALGLTPGAAKVVIHRARRRFRAALVLQLMSDQPSLACATLRTLLDVDVLAAGRHVEDCPDCLHTAGAQLVAFGA